MRPSSARREYRLGCLSMIYPVPVHAFLALKTIHVACDVAYVRFQRSLLKDWLVPRWDPCAFLHRAYRLGAPHTHIQGAQEHQFRHRLCVKAVPHSDPVTMATMWHLSRYSVVGYRPLHPKKITIPCTSLKHLDRTVYVRCLLCRGCSTRAGGVNTHGEPFFLLPTGARLLLSWLPWMKFARCLD